MKSFIKNLKPKEVSIDQALSEAKYLPFTLFAVSGLHSTGEFWMRIVSIILSVVVLTLIFKRVKFIEKHVKETTNKL